jgi:hypothetical protein
MPEVKKMKSRLKAAERIIGISPQTTMYCTEPNVNTQYMRKKGREEMAHHESHHGLKAGTVAVLGITGAAVAYGMLSMQPRKQREIRKGLRNAIDDLNELVDDISDTVRNLQSH